MLVTIFSSQWVPQIKSQFMFSNSNTMTYITSPHFSYILLHPDMLLEENATIPYSSTGNGTSVQPYHKNCQPVAGFWYTDVYISADGHSNCASNKSKIKLCYNQESLLLQHSFSQELWLLVDVDTADEVPCM